MSDEKQDTKKSGTLDNVVREIKTSGCGCGYTPQKIVQFDGR